jgi:hypothetical protein
MRSAQKTDFEKLVASKEDEVRSSVCVLSFPHISLITFMQPKPVPTLYLRKDRAAAAAAMTATTTNNDRNGNLKGSKVCRISPPVLPLTLLSTYRPLDSLLMLVQSTRVNLSKK